MPRCMLLLSTPLLPLGTEEQQLDPTDVVELYPADYHATIHIHHTCTGGRQQHF